MEQLKILILEDSEVDAKMIQQEWKELGLDFIAKAVGTRKSFEEALLNFKPDVVLSDYFLDSFDGPTAFKVKQEQCPIYPSSLSPVLSVRRMQLN